MKDISTFKRGQVWYIEDSKEKKGSIQYKSRPYVVVSNDLCNTYSSIIHLAPITSQSKKVQPTHVTFINTNNERNTILLEQITVKSIPHIIKGARYMYTLSDVIMDKVNESILVQFGLSTNIQRQSTPLTQYIESQEYTSVLEEVAVANESLEESMDLSTISRIDRFNARMDKYKEINNIHEDVPITRSPSGRIKWSTKLKEHFIYESTIKSEEEMLDKYHLKSTTYRNTLNKFKREVNHTN